MARKPEAVFVTSVNKHIPKYIYHEGNSQQFAGGMPDRRYEACHYDTPDLWVEYKFYDRIPPIIELLDIKKKVKLSGLQEAWLKRAYNNGRNIAVIVGCKQGGVIITDLGWQKPISRETFLKLMKSRKEIAEWITMQVG